MKIECINCLSKNVELAFGDSDAISGKQYSYSKCRNCMILFISPFPTKKRLAQIYSFNNINFEKSANSPLIFLWKNPLIRRLFDRWAIGINNERINSVEKYCNTKKKIALLDVGCGAGRFLFEAESKGWKTIGQEVSKRCIADCKKLLSSKTSLFNGEVTKMNINKKITVITLWHVFEHLLNFNQVLEFLSNKTKKGTLLVIETPSVNALSLKLFSRFSPMIITPEHLTFWSEDGLALVLSKNKFKILSVSYPKTFLFTTATASFNFFRNKSGSVIVGLLMAFFITPLAIVIYFLLPKCNESIRVVATRS